MTTDKLNASLIEVMKKQVTDKGQLAATLMDILCIGKEAVYRHLRGEVPFTLNEAFIIAHKMGISLDRLVGLNSEVSAIFDLNFINYKEPVETYVSAIDYTLNIIKAVSCKPDSRLDSASNMIPQSLYLKYDVLAKFRLFKWMYQHEKVNVGKDFASFHLPERVKTYHKEYVRGVHNFKTVNYIWDNLMISYLVSDIKYFESIHLLGKEEIGLLKEEILTLLDEMELYASTGRHPTGNKVNIYISNINFEATYNYVEARDFQLSMIRLYAINSILSLDQTVCRHQKEWIESLRKFSTMISESGEMQRIQFFKKQREIVGQL